jgi:hypothetical protein
MNLLRPADQPEIMPANLSVLRDPSFDPMKKPSRNRPDGTGKRPALIPAALVPVALLRPALILLAWCLLPGSLAKAADDEDAFEINVRTTVDQPFTLFGKKPAPVHGKLYAIAGVKAASNVPGDTSIPLAIPVDEEELLRQLRAVLNLHGYHEAGFGVAPEIVLTVFYGRSQLSNPYTDKSIQISGDGVPVVTASADQMQRERSTPGYAEKVQAANGEKLFIIINAWEFPGFNPKQKRKLLWRTIVNVDDPDQDLNPIAGKMLAVAGLYFDREINKEEISVLSTAPEGKVTIGPSVDVGPGHPGK